MMDNIEIDALWRIEPVKTMEYLAAACFEAEEAERKRQGGWPIRGGGYFAGGVNSVWTQPARNQLSQYAGKNAMLRDQFRTGKCPPREEEHARCGSPQSKLNSLAQPAIWADRTQIFLEKLAPGTRKGYWCAWKQWEMFCEHRQQNEWIDASAGPNWDETCIEFLLPHHKVMRRKAGTLKTKVGAVRYFHIIRGKGIF